MLQEFKNKIAEQTASLPVNFFMEKLFAKSPISGASTLPFET